jgi:hypothetical protein
MRHPHPIPSAVLAAALSLFAALPAVAGPAAPADSATATPIMAILSRFTAPDVPAMGPDEIASPIGRGRNAPTPPGLPGKGLAEHPMLYIGEGDNTIYVVAGGKVIWTYSTGRGNELDDAWMLSNGNIVFTRMQYVAEVTPEKRIIWRYDAPPGTEIHCCQPIGLDKVLFIRNGLPPKLMVMNIKTNAVVVEHVLPAKSLTDRNTIHPQYRRVRYTAQGTYLVPMLGLGVEGKVVEYDRNFHVVWSYAIRSPWAAIRLKNGDTLITDEHDKMAREVDPQGKTVWQVTPQDLPPRYRYINTQSCTRLANGDTIICSRGGHGKGPQLVEVTPAKKVVWVLWDWKDLGPATAVQVLDDPGYPEIPGESQH